MPTNPALSSVTRSPRLLVFDSGIGGMGFVQAIKLLSPALRIDYLADTALFPYGEQPDDLLTERIIALLTMACAHFRPALLVIACNTASTLALSALRGMLDVPIVGCVPPIRWAGRVSKTRVIGLLATSATARRPYIQALHQEFAADCRLITHGARGLADLAEKAFRGEILPPKAVEHELEQLFNQAGGREIDTIGLGCTHYTFLMPAFQRYITPSERPNIMWLDPAPAVAQQALRCLDTLKRPLMATPDAQPNRLFFTRTPEEDPIRFVEWLGFTDWDVFPLINRLEPNR